MSNIESIVTINIHLYDHSSYELDKDQKRNGVLLNEMHLK